MPEGYQITGEGLYQQLFSSNDCVALSLINGIVLGGKRNIPRSSVASLNGVDQFILLTQQQPENFQFQEIFAANNGFSLISIEQQMRETKDREELSGIPAVLRNHLQAGAVLITISKMLAAKFPMTVRSESKHRVTLTAENNQLLVIDPLEPNNPTTISLDDLNGILALSFSAFLENVAGSFSGLDQKERYKRMVEVWNENKNRFTPKDLSFAIHIMNPVQISKVT